MIRQIREWVISPERHLDRGIRGGLVADVSALAISMVANRTIDTMHNHHLAEAVFTYGVTPTALGAAALSAGVTYTTGLENARKEAEQKQRDAEAAAAPMVPVHPEAPQQQL